MNVTQRLALTGLVAVLAAAFAGAWLGAAVGIGAGLAGAYASYSVILTDADRRILGGGAQLAGGLSDLEGMLR